MFLPTSTFKRSLSFLSLPSLLSLYHLLCPSLTLSPLFYSLTSLFFLSSFSLLSLSLLFFSLLSLFLSFVFLSLSPFSYPFSDNPFLVSGTKLVLTSWHKNILIRCLRTLFGYPPSSSTHVHVHLYLQSVSFNLRKLYLLKTCCPNLVVVSYSSLLPHTLQTPVSSTSHR